MDLHRMIHEIGSVVKDGHLPLPLFAGLLGIFNKSRQDLKTELSDLGDLGDNVPTTLLISLSSRRGL